MYKYLPKIAPKTFFLQLGSQEIKFLSSGKLCKVNAGEICSSVLFHQYFSSVSYELQHLFLTFGIVENNLVWEDI